MLSGLRSAGLRVVESSVSTDGLWVEIEAERTHATTLRSDADAFSKPSSRLCGLFESGFELPEAKHVAGTWSESASSLWTAAEGNARVSPCEPQFVVPIALPGDGRPANDMARLLFQLLTAATFRGMRPGLPGPVQYAIVSP